MIGRSASKTNDNGKAKQAPADQAQRHGKFGRKASDSENSSDDGDDIVSITGQQATGGIDIARDVAATFEAINGSVKMKFLQTLQAYAKNHMFSEAKKMMGGGTQTSNLFEKRYSTSQSDL